MYNKILKISMKNKKYSMLSFRNIRYTVNINKQHDESVKWKGENGMRKKWSH